MDRDEEILDWLRIILADEGVEMDQSLRIRNSLTDVIVNQLGDD